MDTRLSSDSKLSVLYEDEDCFVLDKPSGIHSVSLPNDSKSTLASQILQKIPELALASVKTSDGGLVQRLDLETSGVLLGAKTRAAWTALHQALLAGEISKTYLALVEGEIRSELSVNNYIGSSNRRAKKVTVFLEKPRDKDRALPARSLFSNIYYSPEGDCSLVRVTAPTARRHQVRAHAASTGHPLIGDSLYKSVRDLQPLVDSLGFNSSGTPKFLLHAETLSFRHPVSAKTVDITAPLPEILSAFYRLGNISAGGAASSTS